MIDDSYVRKTRGNYVEPKKVQVKSKVINSVNGNIVKNEPSNKRLQQSKQQQQNSRLNALNESPSKTVTTNNELNSNGTTITQNSKVNASTPIINPRKGDYLLNRTHSTEGIASKLSLELKKRYLLGGSGLGGSVMKSGSTSNVDTRLKTFSDSISQHQKLLNTAHEPSPTMQAFLQGSNKLRTSGSTSAVQDNNKQAVSPISPSALFGANSPVKAFPFERKAASMNDTADLNAKNVQLPDLIKESSKFNEVIKQQTINRPPTIEEKPSPTDPPEPPKEPDITSLKIETPTPTIEVKNIVEPSVTLPQVNGERNHEVNNEVKATSPLREMSITVPKVDWDKLKKEQAALDKGEDEEDDDSSTDDLDEIDSDSLSSTDEDDENEANKANKLSINLSPPILQIHSTEGDLLLDQQVDKHNVEDIGGTFEPDSIECSYLLEDMNNKIESISRPTVTIMNEHKEIESVNSNLKQLQLNDDAAKRNFSGCNSPTSLASHPSSHSEENDVTTAAYTETEFSEWAREGDDLVSEDLRDVEYDMQGKPGSKRPSNDRMMARMANGEDLTDVELDFSQEELNGVKCASTIASKMLANGEEDIGFMDTDNESLLDEDSLKEMAKPKNRGYIEFVNFKPNSPMKSKNVAAPIARSELEYDESTDATTPCCDDDVFNVIEFNPVTMDDVRDRLRLNNGSGSGQSTIINGKICEIKITDCDKNELMENVNKDLMSLSMEEDSLLIVEPHEDTTTSEVVTVLASPINPVGGAKGDETSSEATKTPEPAPAPSKVSKDDDDKDPDYLEYVKRLQDRIAEFSNVKDSIDIRKSKRTKSSKPSSLHSQRSMEHKSEEKKIHSEDPSTANGAIKSPATSRKLEELTRERSKQKYVIQDLLMDKLEAHKQKSAEKKAKRAERKTSFHTLNSSPTIRAPPTPVKFMPPTHGNNSSRSSPVKGQVDICKVMNIDAPETLYHAKVVLTSNDDDEEHSANRINSPIHTPTRSTYSPPRMQLDFKTPIAPPRIKHEEARKTADRARQDARARARLKSDEDLGLSPEDRIKELRLKVTRRQLKSETDEETPVKSVTKRYSFGLGHKLQTSKSTDNVKAMARRSNGNEPSAAKSLDELLDADEPVQKREKKKSKDPERRKSIIQAVSDFFKKKDSLSPPGAGKDKLSMFRLTPKSKEKGKLDKVNSTLDKRPKSVCEGMLHVGSFFVESPPPVPPPPINYTMPTTVSDDSLSDEDSKTAALSASQLNKTSNNGEGSCNSIPRKVKTAKRLARQAQLKRLRMAQEIQRKLEETEVKQRELECRGVSVEKALRGEGECSDREEADLLREWFDLMRERSELRRYEKELLVRAQEVQLEDRHDRLEQELRERLADDDEKKTSADVKKEGEILTEMLEIVAKRDSLIALLEEERQRYQEEDRDLEAQMLSKGVMLTPINKRGSKYSV